ncbi:MAG: hypothetical protein DRI93_04550 [Aquificota bacterium]|nr:MAG: hypothetical protein DRI93_04550 [Aquificota bacterium]
MVMNTEVEMTKEFQTFDTTGDTGLEIYGASLEEVFRNALRGLFDLITDLDKIEAQEEVTVEAQGEDWVDLLVSWLNELVFLQDARDWLFKECVIEKLEPHYIKAHCSGERFKKGKHPIKTLVKAATLHQARIEKSPQGYKARVVLDV